MQTHWVYLSCTRSVQTYGGVPALGCGINLTVCYMGFFVAGNGNIASWDAIWIPVFIVTHLLMRAAVEYDPNIFRIIEVGALSFRMRRILWSALPYPPRRLREVPRVL